MKRFHARTLLVLLALAVPFLIVGQGVNDTRGAGTTRSVEGVVTDSGGATKPGAHVLLKDTKSLAVRSFITQADGQYHFYGLSGDIDYEIHAQYQGSSTSTKNISIFNSKKVITVNLKLK